MTPCMPIMAHTDTLTPRLHVDSHMESHYTSAINWILANTCHLEHGMHYLDDFLAVCPPPSPHLHLANHHKALLLDTFAYLHVPVAAEKVEGLSMVLTLLSLELDTDALETPLPEDKRKRLHHLVTNTVTSARFLKCELASFLGHLSFAASAVPAGRTFLRRL